MGKTEMGMDRPGAGTIGLGIHVAGPRPGMRMKPKKTPKRRGRPEAGRQEVNL